MTKQELIKQCRYYNGDDKPSDSIVKAKKVLLFEYEQRWCEDEKFRNERSPDVIEFIGVGLAKKTEKDNVPITLKALLFNRYKHWAGGYGSDEEDFLEWYSSYYLTK